MAEGISVKPASALGWSEVGSRESSLVQRCSQGDADAYAELVEEHGLDEAELVRLVERYRAAGRRALETP